MPIDLKMDFGWGNGYIGIPPEHPWYGKDYDDIDANVHGGLTYSNPCKPREKPDGYWWIGFDTAHLNDNQHNCPESYVDSEIASLVEQAQKAYDTKTTNQD